MRKNKIVVARSWQEFQARQGSAVRRLHQTFGEMDVHLHICVNSNIDWNLVNDLRTTLPNWKINVYTTKILDDYAKKRGALDHQISKFSKLTSIYHLILYHYLWHVLNEDYILSYDDDIFFKEFPIEVMHKIENRIPFCLADQYSNSDKALMGKLVMHFGNWIHDEYYSCLGSTLSSYSGFMGIFNKEIFEQFNSQDDFRKMLEMFEYRQGCESNWGDFKVLIQEQSFLSILNRSFSKRKHEMLAPEDGYCVWQPEKSKVQRCSTGDF